MDNVMPPRNYRDGNLKNEFEKSQDDMESYDWKTGWPLAKPEQPLFTSEVVVYQIKMGDHDWTETCTQPVCIHIYNDVVRRAYRIVSVDGCKVLLNCYLTPSIVITKTGVKFAQWLDPLSKTLYGLGFQSEAEAETFINKFKEVQSKISVARVSQPTVFTECDSSDLSSSIDGPAAASSGFMTDLELLRLENERLKLALADSSMSAKSWGRELHKAQMQNEELKAAVEGFVQLMNSGPATFPQGNPPGAMADMNEPLMPPRKYAADSHHSGSFVAIREQRTLSEDMLGNIGSAPTSTNIISEQLQEEIEENNTYQEHVRSCRPCQENSNLVSKLQHAIEEKIADALALHKVLAYMK